MQSQLWVLSTAEWYPSSGEGSFSFTVAQVVATVDTQAQQDQHTGGGGAGKAPGSRAGSVTGGPVPRQRTGHYVLIISSFLPPK